MHGHIKEGIACQNLAVYLNPMLYMYTQRSSEYPDIFRHLFNFLSSMLSAYVRTYNDCSCHGVIISVLFFTLRLHVTHTGTGLVAGKDIKQPSQSDILNNISIIISNLTMNYTQVAVVFLECDLKYVFFYCLQST